MINYRSISERSFNLIITPVLEWQEISEENTGVKNIIGSFLLPWLVILTIAAGLGAYIFTSRFTFTFTYLIGHMMSVFITMGSSIMLTAWVISEAMPNFKLQKNINASLAIICYSLTPYMAAATVAYLLPIFNVIKILGFYSIYVLYIGLPHIMNIHDNNRIELTAVSTIAFMIISAFIFFIFHSILGNL